MYAIPTRSPTQYQVQPQPAACREAQLQLPSFTFYDVHGVSEWQTIPVQWTCQNAAAALVPAGHTKLYTSQIVSLRGFAIYGHHMVATALEKSNTKN